MVLLLGGCGDDPKPIEPTTSTATIPVPTMPAQATEDTPEGRAAFVAHWTDLVNYTARTGDQAPLLAASEGCAECSELADTTARVRYKGKRVDGNIWLVTRIEMVSTDGTRFIAYVGPNPDLDFEPVDLGIVLPDKPPFRVIDIGVLK